MKDMLRKSTFREIKGSFSRWLAILGIVALGVGFFSGLRVTKEAFTKTGDEYLQRLNMFDYELISTLGIDDNNIKEIEETEGVLYAEGSYSCDALIAFEDSEEGVAKMLSITENINKADLRAGRMPEKGNECLGDYGAFSEKDIGSKIRISDSNEEDTKDGFRYKEYTITGLAESPLYLNFERGSTSLGNGSVRCFIYVPPAGWNKDCFTEMYVKLSDADQEIFSDEYEDRVDSMEDKITAAFESCSCERYDDILAEANEKLNKSEKKLKKAKSEVADGEKEIRDNEKALSDAEKKISEGKAAIKTGKAELAEKKKELEKAKKDLAKAEKEYKAGTAEFEQQKEAAYAPLEPLLAAMKQAEGTPYYDQYKAQYDAAKSKIDAELNKGEAALSKAKKEIDKGRKGITSGEKAIKSGEQQLSSKQAEIQTAETKLSDGRKELSDGKAELADAKAKIKTGEKELKKAKKKVKDIKKPDTYVLTRSSNIGYVCFDSDTAIVQQVAKIFPLFFFLVAALVVMTTMTRMVDEQRTQIGVLKALGYSRRRILGKYIFYTVSAAVTGGIIGFYIGSYLFPLVIWKAYGMMYQFSDLVPVINHKLGAATVLAAIICAVSATLYSCLSEMREVPAELIRPKAPAFGKRIFLERIGFIWRRLPFLHKVSMRNIFRYKKRFVMMLLGICGCTALLVTGMGISDSIKTVVAQQYEEVLKVDYTVSFDEPVSAEDGRAFLDENKDVARKALFVYSVSMDAESRDSVKSVNVIAYDEDSNEYPLEEFIDLHDVNGNKLEYPGTGECIINSSLADRLGLKPGDTLSVHDSDMNTIEATISGTCENFVHNYMYINKETYTKETGKKYTMNSGYVIGVNGSNSEDGAALSNADNVTSASVISEFKERIARMMSALDYVVLLVIACAGALAFIVLYNLTNINITERIREIATIKVLGFNRREVSQYVFRENIVLAIMAAIIGLPLGKLLHAFVMSQIVIDMISFDVHIKATSYIFAFITTLIFAVIVNIFLYFKLDRINMAESLKSVE